MKVSPLKPIRIKRSEKRGNLNKPINYEQTLYILLVGVQSNIRDEALSVIKSERNAIGMRNTA